MPIEVKNFATQADEAKEMPNARMEAVSVLGQRVMKLTLGPEWKWCGVNKNVTLCENQSNSGCKRR